MKRTIEEQKQIMFSMMKKLNPDFKPLNEMMSKIPGDTDNTEGQTSDCEILRASIIAEMDAINLYEQFAAKANSEELKKLLLDIAKEEKTHVGEFQSCLLKLDTEQKKESKSGEKEVEDTEDTEEKSEEIKEGNAFSGAANKAKEDGKDTFEFAGKTYNVK